MSAVQQHNSISTGGERHPQQRSLCYNCVSAFSAKRPADPWIAQWVSGQKLSLLTLPAEIRLRIWHEVFHLTPHEHCLSPETCWKLRGCVLPRAARVGVSFSPRRARTTSVQAALLSCKTVHREAWHLFYRLNMLSFGSPASLFQFLSSLRPRQRESIRRLHVFNLGFHWSTQMAPRAFSLLTLCCSLQELYLDFGYEVRALAPWAEPPSAVPPDDMFYAVSHECVRDGLYVLYNLRGLDRLVIRGNELGLVEYPDKAAEDLESLTSVMDHEIHLDYRLLQKIVTRPRPKGLLTRLQRAQNERIQEYSRRMIADSDSEEQGSGGTNQESKINRLVHHRLVRNWDATSSEGSDDLNDGGSLSDETAGIEHTEPRPIQCIDSTPSPGGSHQCAHEHDFESNLKKNKKLNDSSNRQAPSKLPHLPIGEVELSEGAISPIENDSEVSITSS